MEQTEIKDQVNDLKNEVTELRRHFHQFPELGFQEFQTADYIEKYLQDLGIETKRITETAVIGLLKGQSSGPTLMLRADMDALPVHEETSADYQSKHEGVMHACGHDGHVAMLLVAAKILSQSQEQIAGSIKFVFQPNEEGDTGGAKLLIEKGVLKDPDVDAGMGIHLMSGMKTGEIGISGGPVMADAHIFKLTIIGAGGHTAVAQKSIDPVVTAANIIQSTQIVQTREINVLKPTSIIFSKINAGSAPNIIPEKIEMEGTIRCLYDSLAAENENPCLKFERIVKSICEAHRATYELTLEYSNAAVVNDHQLAESMRKCAEKTVKHADDIVNHVTMIGEDFGDFGKLIPIAFYFIGVGNTEKETEYPHHHAKFDIDEDALPLGVEMHVRGALSYLRKEA